MNSYTDNTQIVMDGTADQVLGAFCINPDSPHDGVMAAIQGVSGAVLTSFKLQVEAGYGWVDYITDTQWVDSSLYATRYWTTTQSPLVAAGQISYTNGRRNGFRKFRFVATGPNGAVVNFQAFGCKL